MNNWTVRLLVQPMYSARVPLTLSSASTLLHSPPRPARISPLPTLRRLPERSAECKNPRTPRQRRFSTNRKINESARTHDCLGATHVLIDFYDPYGCSPPPPPPPCTGCNSCRGCQPPGCSSPIVVDLLDEGLHCSSSEPLRPAWSMSQATLSIPVHP